MINYKVYTNKFMMKDMIMKLSNLYINFQIYMIVVLMLTSIVYGKKIGNKNKNTTILRKSKILKIFKKILTSMVMIGIELN